MKYDIQITYEIRAFGFAAHCANACLVVQAIARLRVASSLEKHVFKCS